MERHFNTVQSGYRTLASTWLLAAFAAIGFVLSTKLTLLVPRELVIAGIGMAASIGIYLLWIIDLLVTPIGLLAAAAWTRQESCGGIPILPLRLFPPRGAAERWALQQTRPRKRKGVT